MPTNDPLAQSAAHAEEKLIIPTVDRQYDKFFRELTRLQEDDVIIKSNCKFCNHPLRAEAEEKWEKMNRTYAPVQRFLNEAHEKNPDNPQYPSFNHFNVRQHLLAHYDQQMKRKFMEEYTSHISSIMNYKRAQDERFEFLSNALEAQFIEIASNPTVDIVKKTDSMVKASKAIADISKIQAELRGDMQPYNRLLDRFRKVWVTVINNQKDDDTKQILLEALSQFQGEIESEPIDE